MKSNQQYRSAFPLPRIGGGLNKREYIATAVLQGMLSNPNHSKNELTIESTKVCKEAIRYADELLNQLSD